MSADSPPQDSLVIGVLALQGAYDAHAQTLFSLGATPKLIRRPDQLDGLDGLIIPGGESTTFLKHLERDGFFDVLNTFVRERPTFGTCAGVILLAKDVFNPTQPSLGALDIAVARNAYGRQIDLHHPYRTGLLCPEVRSKWSSSAPPPHQPPRSPASKLSPSVTARPSSSARAIYSPPPFHPELSGDPRVHQFFLEMVRAASNPS